MRIVFITHNRLGLACLEELTDLGANVQAIYTSPEDEDISDQIGFKSFVSEQNISLHHVESVNTTAVKTEIAEYNPELLFVVGWSRLVDSDILDIPLVAALGMHPAPLPRGRGRAPLTWSLIKGLDETALSFFHLVEEADAGDIVGQESIPIERDDDASSLYEKIVDVGRVLIRRYYPKFAAGEVPRQPQDESQATWWPKREPHHGLVDWNQPPGEIHNWIRGQTRPYPGAFSYFGEQKVTLWSSDLPDDEPALVRPGELLYRKSDALGVGAWEGIIEITEVAVSEDEAVPASALVTEYGFEIGDRFRNARDQLTTEL